MQPLRPLVKDAECAFSLPVNPTAGFSIFFLKEDLLSQHPFLGLTAKPPSPHHFKNMTLPSLRPFPRID